MLWNRLTRAKLQVDDGVMGVERVMVPVVQPGLARVKNGKKEYAIRKDEHPPPPRRNSLHHLYHHHQHPLYHHYFFHVPDEENYGSIKYGVNPDTYPSMKRSITY